MSRNQKMILGFILGFVGYVAYKKLNGTKTVVVDSFDTAMPNVIDINSLAGRRF